MILWLVPAAGAAVPDGVRPAVVGLDVPLAVAAWRQREGLPADALACEPLWPGATLLCWRVWEDGRRRWVLGSDLERWAADAAALRAAVVKAAEARLEGAERVPVGGMEASWHRHVDGDWAAAGVLLPDALAAKVGGLPVRVGVPGDGVLVAWKGGDPDLDRVMAVGVREIFDAQPVRVTPHVWQWDGRAWSPFGEAVPKTLPQ